MIAADHLSALQRVTGADISEGFDLAAVGKVDGGVLIQLAAGGSTDSTLAVSVEVSADHDFKESIRLAFVQLNDLPAEHVFEVPALQLVNFRFVRLKYSAQGSVVITASIAARRAWRAYPRAA